MFSINPVLILHITTANKFTLSFSGPFSSRSVDMSEEKYARYYKTCHDVEDRLTAG